MSGSNQPTDRDEVIGKLSEDLAVALAVGEAIDEQQWAERFGLQVSAVRECRRGLDALALSLGEEDIEGPIELPQPELPDDFELGDELGRGGMGVVYRARQRSLDREVAIKVLRPGDLVFGDALRRFRSEARSLARLRHRHIVSVYDSGETPEGLLWFTMDLVEGRTLADELRGKKRMLTARAVRILRQVTSAVAHAHAQGIVHRDLKPQNVLIDAGGDAYVVDFGLARDATAHGTRTLSGELLGTPEYMSPEQASGDAGRISEASDVWALGALLYELLSGRGPFSGLPLHETIRAILEDEPPPLQRDKRVPAGLALVCSKALQKRPEDRYAGALAFGEDLERFQDGRGVLAEKPSRLRRVQRVLRRRWRAIATVAAAVLVMLLAFATWVPTIRRDAVLEQSRQLMEAGHPDAAIPSLRKLLAESAASDKRTVQYDLARALNDRAGDLLLADDLAGAGKLAKEAYKIASGTPFDAGIVRVGELPQRHSWNWELARAASLHAPQEELFSADFVDRLRDEITCGLPGRREMARQVAALGRISVAGLPESLRQEVLIESVRYAANHPQDVRTQRSMFPIMWADSRKDAWWSPSSEDALANTALDPDESAATRAVSLRAWLQLTGFPISGEIRGLQSTSDRDPTAEQIAACAEVAIPRWRAAQALPREAAVKARIDLLVEAMRQPFAVLPTSEARVLQMARSWTGSSKSNLPDVASFTNWWSTARARPYGVLLRERLGLSKEQPITLRQALDQSATYSQRESYLWRQLAWLEIPDGKRFLACRPNPRGRGLAWRSSCLNAAGIADDRELTVRCAVLRFDDGAVQPELVAQTSKPARIGDELQLGIEAQVCELGTFSLRRDIWADDWDRVKPTWAIARAGKPLASAPRTGSMRAVVEGYVALHRDGVLFAARGQHGMNLSMPWTSTGRDHPCDARTWMGAATSFACRTVQWDSGRRITSFVLLVGLAEGGAPPAAELDWWRAACERSFQLAASARPHSNQVHAASWAAAALWPMPNARADMHSLLSRSPEVQINPTAVDKRVAAMLAGGDTQMLDAWPVVSAGQAAAIGVRLALASPSEQVRTLSIERLAKLPDDAWTPRLARTLREPAATSGLDLPAALIKRLDAQPTPDGLWDTLWNSDGGQAIGLLVLLAGLCWRDMRKHKRRRLPVYAWPALVLVLLTVRVQIGGIILTPSFVGMLAVTAAVWASGRGPVITWQRVLGLGVLGLATLWSLLTWLFGIEPPQGLAGWLLAAALLAGVPWSERAAQKRARSRPLRRNRH